MFYQQHTHATKSKKVKCKYCSDERGPDPTRMKEHLEKRHTNEARVQGEVVLDSQAVSSRSIETPPPTRPTTLVGFMDRKWTEAGHYHAAMSQVGGTCGGEVISTFLL